MACSTKVGIWSLSACLALGVPCFAEVVESNPAGLFSTAPQSQSDVVVSDDATAGVVEASVAPAEDADSETPADPVKKEVAETIHERYPSRAVKVERHVVQDASGNYVNHGLYTMFDEDGTVIGRGEYRYGARQGAWTRLHRTVSGGMLSQAPYKNFVLPIVSEATFENGQLHGTWVMHDARDRKISEFAFAYGERHGKSVWYYPSGDKMREIDFGNGQIDGTWQEWGVKRDLTINENYQNGRRLGKKAETYSGGAKHTDATYLFAREVLKCEADWWNGSITVEVEKEGKDQRHGNFISWFKNGQIEVEGQYFNDQPIGKFDWWYENGQKSIEGEFDAGRQTGKWTWWHENGQKAATGEFVTGTEAGKWTWWKEDGKVANSARITEKNIKVEVGEPIVTETPQTAAAAPAPKSVPPTPKVTPKQATRVPRTRTTSVPKR